MTESEGIRRGDGDGRTLRWTIDPAGVSWQPANLQLTERLSFWTRIDPTLRHGRVYERCLVRGDGVFIEGCRSGEGDRVGACGHRPVVITPGDGTIQPRLDDLASAQLTRLSFFALSCLLVLLYFWQLVRQRGLPQALIRWNPARPDVDRPGGAKIMLWFLASGPLLLLSGYELLYWIGVDLIPEASWRGTLWPPWPLAEACAWRCWFPSGGPCCTTPWRR